MINAFNETPRERVNSLARRIDGGISKAATITRESLNEVSADQIKVQVIKSALVAGAATVIPFFGSTVAVFNGTPVETARTVVELSPFIGVAAGGITFLALDTKRFVVNLLAKARSEGK